jgi:hypothetical protein
MDWAVHAGRRDGDKSRAGFLTLRRMVTKKEIAAVACPANVYAMRNALETRAGDKSTSKLHLAAGT